MQRKWVSTFSGKDQPRMAHCKKNYYQKNYYQCAHHALTLTMPAGAV